MKKIFFLFCCAMLLLTACSTSTRVRSGNSTPRSRASATLSAATETPQPASSDTPMPTDTPTLEPTATSYADAPVDLIHDAICRMGPGESYYEVVPYFEKSTVFLHGRTDASDWVLVKDAYIDDPLCWIPATALAPLNGLDSVSVADYPTLPAVPIKLTAPVSVCGVASRPLILQWSPVASGSQYRLYRNGELISTQSDGSYYDLNVPKPQKPVVYSYVLQTFNDYGNSPFTLSVSVSVCAK